MYRKIMKPQPPAKPATGMRKVIMPGIARLLLVTVLGWSVILSAQAQSEPAKEKIYEPSASVLQQLGEEQARQQILELVIRRGFRGSIIAPHEIGFGVRGIWVLGVMFHDDRIELRVDDSDKPVRSFSYRDIPLTWVRNL